MLPASEKLNGVAEDLGNNAKVVVVFQNRNDSTSPHELMHAMGLVHSFDNDGKYTYEITKTDNIMDYTHWINKNRFSTSRWQWKILNSQGI
jgi:Metallo-peptidase family M12B Reprolysin-like